MKFSERMGYTKPKDVIQYDSMDNDLKNDLWNLYYKYYLPSAGVYLISSTRVDFRKHFNSLWTEFFKKK